MSTTIDLAAIPTIKINPKRMCGKPCLRGTRFPVAQILAELADGNHTVTTLAEDFGLDREAVIDFLHELAMTINAVTDVKT